MATPIEFVCETTRGRTMALSALRGKPALVFVETVTVALQQQNEPLRARLKALKDERPDLEELVSIVPVVAVWDVAGMARVARQGLVKGIARQNNVEIWFDATGDALRAIRGDEQYSSVAILDASGAPVWAWRGPVQIDEFMDVLAREIEKTFPGRLSA